MNAASSGRARSGGACPNLRALIVDDELPARSELGFLLDDLENVTVVGEADNVRDAVALIKSRPADVLFLDINMPGVTGIQLAEGLKTHPRPPAVVFVTAHSHFAVKAFELNALDYLVKPVEVDRLRAAIEKVAARFESHDLGFSAAVNAGSGTGGDGSGAAESGTDGLPPVSGYDENARVMVSKGGKKLFIPARDISFIMARDDYSYLFTARERFLSTLSLTKLEQQLQATRMFRVHRRYLVNLASITSVNTHSGGTLTVTVDGSDEIIPVSRRRVPALKTALEL